MIEKWLPLGVPKMTAEWTDFAFQSMCVSFEGIGMLMYS